MIEISGFTDEVSYDLDEQIKVLKQLNQHFMCPRRIDNKNIADYTAEEFIEKIKPRLDKANIKFSSIGSPIGKIDVYDEKGYEIQLLKLAELVKIAKQIDCKYIRIFSFYVNDGNYAKAFPEVVKKLNGFLKVAKESEVILLHENEKKIYGDIPERVLQIYSEINDENFKLCFDASNYVQCGVDPYDAYSMLKPFTVYYHMKDCDRGYEVPLGTGQGRIEQIVGDLVDTGYQGFLTLEPHTAKYALLKKIIYILPNVGNIKTMREVYKKIDKDRKVKSFQSVSRKDVYRWQFENLINILERAGYNNG